METVGHKLQKEFLKKSQQLGKIPNAFLFVGKEGIGKKLLALEFAKGLLCQKFEPFGCNGCKSCRQINSFIEALKKGEEDKFFYYARGDDGKKHFAYLIGDHPDLAVVIPDGNQIKIDQIRELQEFVALKPTGKFKVIIIDQAGKMNPQAQNALLKTLEEPPPGTLFILISTTKGELLPTIVSRCQVLEFKPLKPQEVREVLKRLNRDIPKEVENLILEEGSFDLLKVENENLFTILSRLSKYSNLTFEEIVKLAEEIEKFDTEEKELFLKLIEEELTKKVVNGEFPLEVFERVKPLLEDMKVGLKRGLKFKLAVENLLFTLKGF